jgi:hypothetical protein
MTTTRIDWWLGVMIVALSLLAHAFIPRYQIILAPESESSRPAILRVDRWTGRLEVVADPEATPWLTVRGVPSK